MVGDSKELQDVAMAALIKYTEIFTKTIKEIDETYFSNLAYRLIYRCILKHYNEFVVLPSKKELALLIRENHTPDFGELSSMGKTLDDLFNSDLSSEDFALDRVVEFIQRVRGERAFEKFLKVFDGKQVNIPSVVSNLADAMTVTISRAEAYELSDIKDLDKIKSEALGGSQNPVIIKFFLEDLNNAMQYNGFIPGTLNCVSARPGSGKLLANDTPVLTRDGWKKHGDLKVGDYVIGLDGKYKKVIHVHPKYIANRCVEFSNGEKILCHARHEWMVSVNAHRFEVRETQDIEKVRLERGISGKRGHEYTCKLPIRDYIEGETTDLPVKPYTLGVWLGDGTNKHPRITSPFSDIEVIEGVKADGYKVTSMAVHKTTGVPTYYCDFRSGLRELGMCNSRFVTDKYIPEMYLTASIDQRLDLLAGLIDTDGWLNGNKFRFSTTSERLRDTFCELVSTFGWRISVHKDEPKVSSSGIIGRKAVYTIGFTPDCLIPCRLPRKQNKNFASSVRRKISITKISEIDPVEGNCITVDGNGMYLVGKTMIPTHNTTLLINQGMATAQQGYNILHVFLGDMSVFDAYVRYVSCYSGIPSKKLVALTPDDLGKLIQKYNMSGIFSNITVASYAADELTAGQLMEEIQSIQKKKKKHYDVIIVDYDENISYEDVDMYKSGGQVYNKLALFSRKNKSCIFIASQPKQEYWSHEILPMESLSESSKKQKIIDSLITLGKPNRGSTVGTLHLAKNRRGTEGKIYRVSINGANAQFKHITEDDYMATKQQERNERDAAK